MTTTSGNVTTVLNDPVTSTVKNLKKATSGKYEPTLVIYGNEPDSVEIGGKKKTGKQTVLKGAALLATAAGLIYLAKSGKFAKIGEMLEGLKPKQNLSLEEFQQKGGFEGGIAKLKNKLFSGTITVNGKEGEVTTLTYDKGKITESIKQGVKNGDFNANITKQYSYAEDGTTTITKTLGNIMDENAGTVQISEKTTTTIFPDKTNVRITEAISPGHTQTKLSGTFFVDGKPTAVKIVPDTTSTKSGALLVQDAKTGKEIAKEDAVRIIQEVSKLW